MSLQGITFAAQPFQSLRMKAVSSHSRTLQKSSSEEETLSIDTLSPNNQQLLDIFEPTINGIASQFRQQQQMSSSVASQFHAQSKELSNLVSNTSDLRKKSDDRPANVAPSSLFSILTPTCMLPLPGPFGAGRATVNTTITTSSPGASFSFGQAGSSVNNNNASFMSSGFGSAATFSSAVPPPPPPSFSYPTYTPSNGVFGGLVPTTSTNIFASPPPPPPPPGASFSFGQVESSVNNNNASFMLPEFDSAATFSSAVPPPPPPSFSYPTYTPSDGVFGGLVPTTSTNIFASPPPPPPPPGASFSFGQVESSVNNNNASFMSPGFESAATFSSAVPPPPPPPSFSYPTYTPSNGVFGGLVPTTSTNIFASPPPPPPPPGASFSFGQVESSVNNNNASFMSPGFESAATFSSAVPPPPPPPSFSYPTYTPSNGVFGGLVPTTSTNIFASPPPPPPPPPPPLPPSASFSFGHVESSVNNNNASFMSPGFGSAAMFSTAEPPSTSVSHSAYAHKPMLGMFGGGLPTTTAPSMLSNAFCSFSQSESSFDANDPYTSAGASGLSTLAFREPPPLLPPHHPVSFQNSSGTIDSFAMELASNTQEVLTSEMCLPPRPSAAPAAVSLFGSGFGVTNDIAMPVTINNSMSMSPVAVSHAYNGVSPSYSPNSPSYAPTLSSVLPSAFPISSSTSSANSNVQSKSKQLYSIVAKNEFVNQGKESNRVRARDRDRGAYSQISSREKDMTSQNLKPSFESLTCAPRRSSKCSAPRMRLADVCTIK